MSGDGRVVLGVQNSATGNHGFRWTRENGFASLLDLPGGESLSAPYAANEDGSFIVGIGYSEAGPMAVKWAPTDTQVIVDPALSFQFNHATDMSRDGTVVVGAGSDATGGYATRWTEANGAESLGVLPGARANYSIAMAVSADGSVIVGESESANSVHAFRWTRESGMINLGNLSGPSPQSVANDVSDDGRVIVGQTSSRGYYDAFIWTEERGMVALRDLGGNGGFGYDCIALGTNRDGSIVVGSGYTGESSAFLWTEANGVQSIWDLLVEQGVNPALDGWTRLDSAEEITADGLTIVGTGFRNGHFEAFIVTLPEPTLLLPTLALFALCGRARTSLPTSR